MFSVPTALPTMAPTSAPTPSPVEPNVPTPSPVEATPSPVVSVSSPTALPTLAPVNTVVPTPQPTEEPSPGSCGNGQSQFQIQITTDQWVPETTWQLYEWTRGSSTVGALVVQNRNGGYPEGNTAYDAETTCIANDPSGENCYALRMEDSFGDGMCCRYGNGGYRVEIDGSFSFEGGKFAFFQWRAFCLP